MFPLSNHFCFYCYHSDLLCLKNFAIQPKQVELSALVKKKPNNGYSPTRRTSHSNFLIIKWFTIRMAPKKSLYLNLLPSNKNHCNQTLFYKFFLKPIFREVLSRQHHSILLENIFYDSDILKTVISENFDGRFAQRFIDFEGH